MAQGDKTLFDKYIKEMRDLSVFDTLKTGTSVTFETESNQFIPDKSYETGPWLTHLVPKEKHNGYERVWVCKACMTIGHNFMNDNICSFCGSRETERIVAQWNNRPWYKRWFKRLDKNNHGEWEGTDVDV